MSHSSPLRLLLALVAALAGPATLPAQEVARAPLPDWIMVDDTARTVTLALRVAPARDQGPAAINELREGALQVIVPLGWTVRWRWENADPARAHSLVLMAEREKLPERGGRPAFANAMTRMVTKGLAPGQTDETAFVAEAAGWYWLLCGVPAHALEGEYLGLRVDPEAVRVGVRRE
ncbi:MAG TPA: sulfocyanin-like copper-binding protein [Gemmatimonadales bacterium]|nr:sulfocyanin-like copper-binding protein [Gemmatimonadales bacterium]